MEPRAFTRVSDRGLLSTLPCSCTVFGVYNLQMSPGVYPAPRQVHALWDTGCMHTMITDAVAMELCLPVYGTIALSGVTGRAIARTYRINIILPNGMQCSNWFVIGGVMDNCEMLIGMDIISLGDFAVSNYGNRTKYTYQIPSTHDTDYYAELCANGIVT